MLPRSIKGHIACRHIVNKFQLADAREAERNPKEAPNLFSTAKRVLPLTISEAI
ncbi:hypothetical protein [Serratia fonticola]|uniref:Uncharacterized protein n=1 Tax=Serratia fonticola TaxID=47917 RepID=A0ABY9PUS8_SERFO|nr:hypothetical protein [Serratia fonticola]WMT17223.1 hypothetical protein RFB13_13265 [Serratia fonticola]WMT17232.1 hypothetical protein RFB13_13310 [Serratia fonticola]